MSVKKAIIDAGIIPLHVSKIREIFRVYHDLFLTCLARRNKKLLEKAFRPEDYSKFAVEQMYEMLQHISNETIKNVYYFVDTYKLPKDLSNVKTEICY